MEEEQHEKKTCIEKSLAVSYDTDKDIYISSNEKLTIVEAKPVSNTLSTLASSMMNKDKTIENKFDSGEKGENGEKGESGGSVQMSEWREYGEIGECREGGNWREWRVERRVESEVWKVDSV